MRPRSLLLLALLVAVPLAAAAPEQVHLGLPTADPSTSLSVHWLDLDPRGNPVVTVRTPDGEMTFPGRRVDGPSAGVAYEAVLEGLPPGTAFDHTITGGKTYAARTAPAPDAETPVRLVALGDMGIRPAAQATVATIVDLAPDLLLHAGDLSYAEGRAHEWKTWFDLVEPVAATRPWVTALGNHETYSGHGIPFGLTGTPSPAEIAFYKQRFGLPGNELWYSFDWGPLHIVALDTFSERSIPQAQVAWLEEDLAANVARPWTIVVLHEPPYSSNRAHGESPRVQDAFVAIFEKHGVDLVIGAHDHSYERTFPLVDKTPTSTGPGPYARGAGVVYVVTGGGGNGLYPDFESRPAWSAARVAEYHVVEITATPDRLAGRFVATEGASFTDAFEILATGGEAPAAVVTRDDTPLPTWTVGAAVLAAVGLARLAKQGRQER